MISVSLQEDHFEQLLDTTSESVNILFCSAGLPAVAATLCVCNTLSSCCSFCDRLQRQLCEAAALPPLVLSLHCTLEYIHTLPTALAKCTNVLCPVCCRSIGAVCNVLYPGCKRCALSPDLCKRPSHATCAPSLPCSHYLSAAIADYFSPLLALFVT